MQDGPRCRCRTQTGTGIRVKETGAVVPGWCRKFHGEKEREGKCGHIREKKSLFFLACISVGVLELNNLAGMISFFEVSEES
jgi:hypothetical protein